MAKLGVPYWTESMNETAAVSWFGVAGYTYKNRYTVSFNARTDGSNRFGLKTNEVLSMGPKRLVLTLAYVTERSTGT